MLKSVVALVAFGAGSAAVAQPFQLIVTVSPPGSSSNPANWQPTLRVGVNGPGGSTFGLPSIPTTEVFDPAGIAFRSASDLFVGNRHGNILGLGSISRFTLSPDGSTTTFVQNFTAPGMVGVHEIAYDATRTSSASKACRALPAATQTSTATDSWISTTTTPSWSYSKPAAEQVASAPLWGATSPGKFFCIA